MSDNTAFSTEVQVALDLMVSGDFTAYDGMERKERIQVRKALDEAIAQSIREGDVPTGQHLLSVKDELAGRSKTSEKSEVPPAEQIGQRVSNLLEAAKRLAFGLSAPEGTEATDLGVADIRVIWNDDVEADKQVLPDFNDEAVKKLVSVRIGRKTKQNDIPRLVREAFESVEIGTFYKISGIRARIGTKHPELGVSAEWDGRISAALFGKKGVEGVKPVNSDSPDYLRFQRNGGIKVESDVWDNPDFDDDSDVVDEEGNTDNEG